MRKGSLLLIVLIITGLVLLAALPWGIELAQAGPGGGTYYANSPAGGVTGTALRKFVDRLPGLGAANANNLGQYIPIAVPDTTSYPGSDYYSIGIVEYTEKMHSDLPKATKLRGYKDLMGGGQPAHYLGPLIVAKRDRPVRVLVENQLPMGAAGNLFIPVDTTVMGAGTGAGSDPYSATRGTYSQNRTAVHLHGGATPWISDGTPHQWFTPTGTAVNVNHGWSFRNVPDMPDPGAGKQTIYYTNQQSNRLMFYHDHAYGITRLNVYSGMAAGYLLTDSAEDDLIARGVIPNQGGGVYNYGIPLIIQDKTFVPQNIATQDALWNTIPNVGGYGDIWFPHVYEPNQDPAAPDGTNPFGRWDYGPWFWPVFPAIAPLPNPSIVPEAFMDTMMVNGTAYPYLQVEPKAYRFRILNACNDRNLNLQVYKADPANPTEVIMVPAVQTTGFPETWPTDGRAGGVPDPATAGPKMIQIGSEGGFLPQAVVLTNQPVNYDYNRRNIVVLNVSDKTLFMGPAERADVIIDFSGIPSGTKVILYNDAPAPVPAFDPRYDYYTGNPDQTASGGTLPTVAGFGPNTRTIMQFQVVGTPAAPFNLATLQNATTGLPAAYVASQPPPIVPQVDYPPPYQAAVNTYARIQDTSLTFTPVGATSPKTIFFQPKAIQELFDPYGRMNATLGVELPFTSALIQTTIPLMYIDPTTEAFRNGDTQIWKITHNGVDTHSIHFHLFNVQVINRVGWDGQIRPPDPNELGWKETVRMHPLEDIVVAMKAVLPTIPFYIPPSFRPLDVTQALGTTVQFTGVDPATGNPKTVTNAITNFQHEYVWHCHLLGHEENDMMRPMTVLKPFVPIWIYELLLLD